MNHLKLFEEFKPLSSSNIYSLMGQNMTNYTKSLRQKLVNMKINIEYLKKIDELSQPDRAKTLTSKDLYKVMESFFTDLISKIKNAKPDELKNLHFLHYMFVTYVLVSLKYDLSKASKLAKHGDDFKIYKLTKVTDLKQQQSWIDRKFAKLNTDKVQQLVLNDVNIDWKNIQPLFNSEKALKYRDLKSYSVKPDEQQHEAENNINNFVSKINNEQIEKIQKLDQKEVAKIKNLKEIPNFNEEFLKRFDQPGLPGSHKMMKPWFLLAFQKAEKAFGKPFYITSGIRTEEYQQYLTSLGYQTAKKNSPHIAGVAADIGIVGLDVDKIIAAFENVGFTRFGVGKSFIHVDMGDYLNPKIWIPYSRWTYNY